MRTFAIAEAIYFTVALLAFAVLYALRSNWRRSWTGRNLMAFMVGIFAFVGFQVLGLVQPVPDWVYAIILGELCYAATERVWLLVLAQRQR